MKRLFTFIIIFIIFTVLVPCSSKINAEENSPSSDITISSPSAVLMDYSTGAILFQKNEHQKMYPASMTKMMAIYLFLEKISNSSHSLEETVRVSTFASSMGGSQIFLKENEEMSFEDLLKGVTIASANDAVVALAEHTYGSANAFIQEMNKRAKLFEMNETNFVNITGFHDKNHYTTSYDMALLARKLLKDYGDILLKYTSIYDTYLRTNTTSPFWLVNTNKMIKTYSGMDGLKTGYTSESGFNLTATAKRDNFRLISVVMGSSTSKERTKDTSTILDYGFNNYKIKTLYKKGEKITNVTFENAKTTKNEIVAREDIIYLCKKNDDTKSLNATINITKQTAPISKDESVGYIELNDKYNTKYELYSRDDIEQLSFLDLFFKLFKLGLA